MLVTWLFLPDTTGLDLKEQERRWTYIRAGRDHEYHGIAVHPSHLSVWERFRGVGKHYDPDLDYKQKIEEMRGEWEDSQRRIYDEKKDAGVEFDDQWSDDVSSFFKKTKGRGLVNQSVKDEIELEKERANGAYAGEAGASSSE